MVHLTPLPGSPRWEGSLERVMAAALADAGALVDGGGDALLVENYGDAPFTAGPVEPATVAAMAVVAAEIRRAFPRALLGVNGLKNDARAARAISTALGGRFIRVNVHAGAVVADQGLVQTDAYHTPRDRPLLGADVAIFADVGGKHALPLVRGAVPDVPLLVGSGGLIVGTYVKRDGDVRKPVDPARVERLVGAARRR